MLCGAGLHIGILKIRIVTHGRTEHCQLYKIDKRSEFVNTSWAKLFHLHLAYLTGLIETCSHSIFQIMA
jgi:hypothetical protein